MNYTHTKTNQLQFIGNSSNDAIFEISINDEIVHYGNRNTLFVQKAEGEYDILHIANVTHLSITNTRYIDIKIKCNAGKIYPGIVISNFYIDILPLTPPDIKQSVVNGTISDCSNVLYCYPRRQGFNQLLDLRANFTLNGSKLPPITNYNDHDPNMIPYYGWTFPLTANETIEFTLDLFKPKDLLQFASMMSLGEDFFQ